jgi:hypothetical protein
LWFERAAPTILQCWRGIDLGQADGRIQLSAFADRGKLWLPLPDLAVAFGLAVYAMNEPG